MCHDPQQFIARSVPQSIVDLFESVQVDEEDSALIPLLRYVVDASLCLGQQEPAIGQASQRVIERHALNGLTLLLPVKCQHAQVRTRRHQVGMQRIGSTTLPEIQREGRSDPPRAVSYRYGPAGVHA
ncbi:hypothetical protein D3C76_1184230 [compost metagenome]